MRENRFRGRKRSSGSDQSWIMTFADMMALLLCFFVLLLSFSEMDRHKFKVISGSLEEAFGVQRKDPIFDIPKGVDLIRQEFDDPNFMIDDLREKIRSAIKRSEMEGNIKVIEDEVSVTISFPERALFDSGSAQLKDEALPILDGFGEVIQSAPHQIMIVGHTDSIPINTPTFPSNWELSAARASSVVRHFLSKKSLAPDRLIAVGRADTVPLCPNDSKENRARNRRVEMVFQKKVAVKPIRSHLSPRVSDTVGLNTGRKSKSMRRWYW